MQSDQVRLLVVAAHPDDEVLGCGGTMARHALAGHAVHVLFLTDGVSSRGAREDMTEEIERRAAAAARAAEILGAHPPRLLGLPDNRLDEMPLLELVKRVEEAVSELEPTYVYTHHGGDLNVDHRLAHQAVMTACRPRPENTVRAIYSFEVVSSTEWATPAIGPAFRPNRFADIGRHLEQKIQALEAYSDEIRDFPHARSKDAVLALARLRGASVGLYAAESFIVEREIV